MNATNSTRPPLRSCGTCGETNRSWTKTVMCCGRPMNGAPARPPVKRVSVDDIFANKGRFL